MIEDASRLAASVAAIPAGGLIRAVQSASTGRHAILDLTVERSEDAMHRQGIVHRLRRAAVDPAVGGALLRFESPPGSWASCQDLRDAILRLRAAGKPVYAWLESPGNALIWIAAACDRIFLAPMGEVGLVGVGVEMTFFGRALERLGVQPDFEAAGAYKSFGEAYTRSFASPANQEAMQALAGDRHHQLVQGIAEQRGLDSIAVQQLLARGPLSANEALEAKLVDQLCYQDELESWISQHHGRASSLLEFQPWARRDRFVEWVDRWGDAATYVPVVYLDGPIVVEEKGPAVMIRSRRVVPMLKKLREDSRVSAVVLHVNSGGGSALASDLIWREVVELQKVKPVVACFEDVAASGGYYLAAPCAEIVARAGTLTGSIGVFGGKLVVGEGLRKIGVTTQEITSAPNATIFSPTRHFNDEQRIRFRASLQRFYDGFVQRVATGRKTTVDVIEPHCRGRVWTGRRARELGLVDRQGDLLDALERARVLANLQPGAWRRVDVSAQPNRGVLSRVVQQAMRGIVPRGASAEQTRLLTLASRLVGEQLTPALELVLTHPEQPLALMPWDIVAR